MKISLTMKNNLIHIISVIAIVTIITMVAATNARYQTVAEVSGKADFATTVLEVEEVSNNSYVIATGDEIKLQYQVSNSDATNINTNNLRYYLEVVDENGAEVEGIDIKIREALDDGATFDTATAMTYTSDKGFGQTILRCDGVSEIKTFDVFLKCDSSVTAGGMNLKLQVYAESITNTDFYITRTLNIELNVVNSNNISPLSITPVIPNNLITEGNEETQNEENSEQTVKESEQTNENTTVNNGQTETNTTEEEEDEG